MRKGETHGRRANTGDYLVTGYALKKLVHQDSEGDTYNKAITYPWPMIRLSELYLMYAESLNESSGPSLSVRVTTKQAQPLNFLFCNTDLTCPKYFRNNTQVKLKTSTYRRFLDVC